VNDTHILHQKSVKTIEMYTSYYQSTGKECICTIKNSVAYMPIYYIMCIERIEIHDVDCIF